MCNIWISFTGEVEWSIQCKVDLNEQKYSKLSAGHVRLAFDENPAVTNIDDCQEIPMENGMQVQNILYRHEHSSTASSNFGVQMF